MSTSSSGSGCGCYPLVIDIFISCIAAKLGWVIHGSIFWCIVDFIFWPFAIIKWLVFEELTLRVIKHAFSWFFQ